MLLETQKITFSTYIYLGRELLNLWRIAVTTACVQYAIGVRSEGDSFGQSGKYSVLLDLDQLKTVILLCRTD